MAVLRSTTRFLPISLRVGQDIAAARHRLAAAFYRHVRREV